MHFQFASTFLLISAISPTFVTAHDCANIIAGTVHFNVKALGGPRSVFAVEPTTPTRIRNTTFTIDICSVLGRSTDKPKDEECPNGTQLCALERFYSKDSAADKTEPAVQDRWSIAGDFLHENRRLDATYTRLKGSDSHADAGKEGFRMEMRGGLHRNVKQKALVEFLCDRSKSGLEGLSADGTSNESSVKRRAEEEGGKGDGQEENPPLPDPNKGKALQLVSYNEETTGVKDEIFGVLRLEWSTKYACEEQKDADGTSPPSADTPQKQGRGFFTWFIIIVFLAVAAYLIFGSWLNYSRYGARGWDLLPHGDAIRDVPYLLREWARRVLSTVQGGGNSRGYSAI